MTTTVIMPSKITEGDVQNVTADLSKFDVAKSMVAMVVIELKKCLVITTKEQQATALETAKDANEILKAIEEKRKLLVKPFNDSVTEINAYAKKDLSTEVLDLIGKIKASALEFQKAEDKKAQQALIVAREKVLVDLGFEYNEPSNLFTRERIGTITMNEVTNYDDATFKKVTDGFISKALEASKKEAETLSAGADLIEAFGSDEDKTKLQSINTPSAAPAAYVAPINTGKGLKGLTKKWVFEITDHDLVPREYMIVDDKSIKYAITQNVREIPGVRIYQEESVRLL